MLFFFLIVILINIDFLFIAQECWAYTYNSRWAKDVSGLRFNWSNIPKRPEECGNGGNKVWENGRKLQISDEIIEAGLLDLETGHGVTKQTFTGYGKSPYFLGRYFFIKAQIPLVSNSKFK